MNGSKSYILLLGVLCLMQLGVNAYRMCPLLKNETIDDVSNVEKLLYNTSYWYNCGMNETNCQLQTVGSSSSNVVTLSSYCSSGCVTDTSTQGQIYTVSSCINAISFDAQLSALSGMLYKDGKCFVGSGKVDSSTDPTGSYASCAAGSKFCQGKVSFSLSGASVLYNFSCAVNCTSNSDLSNNMFNSVVCVSYTSSSSRPVKMFGLETLSSLVVFLLLRSSF